MCGVPRLQSPPAHSYAVAGGWRAGIPSVPAKYINMKRIIIIIIILLAILFFWFRVRPSFIPISYTLDNAEGTCSSSSQCKYAGDGCGGGHGICTNNPKKYEGRITICDINMKHPSNQGYTCSCIRSLGKCGWVK